MFFVISGYLITGHLWRNRAAGWSGLPPFWGRRVVRLAPAAVATVLLAGIITVIAVPSFYWLRYAREAVASLAIGENLLLISDSVDYLAGDNSPSPFQHFWSLSVEEQFYIFWPLAIVLGIGFLSSRLRSMPSVAVATVAIALLAAVSLAGAVWAVAGAPSDAYFSMPLRIWEFCFGAILALQHESLMNTKWASVLRRSAWPSAVMFALYAALGICGFLYGGTLPFPGLSAVVPVGLTAMIILIRPMVVRGQTGLQLLEESRPVKYIADNSYAAYLVHWPLIILAPFILGKDLGVFAKVVILVATFVVAQLITSFIEAPLRRRSGARGLKGSLSVSLVAALITGAGWVAIGYAGKQSTPDEGQTYSPAELANECFASGAVRNPDRCSPVEGNVQDESVLAAGQADRPSPWKKSCVAQVESDAQPVCEYLYGAEDARSVVLWGDSHAGAWSPALEEGVRSTESNLYTFTRDGCPASLVSPEKTVFRDVPEQERVNCRARNAQVQSFIEDQEKPVLVVLTSLSTNYEYPAGAPFGDVDHLVRDISEAGNQVVLLGDVPLTGDNKGDRLNVGECLIKSYPNLAACHNGRDRALDTGAQRAFLEEELDNDQWVFVDPSENFCDATSCFAIAGGVPVYFDASHLTDTYARSIAPWMREQLSELLVR